MSAFSHAGHTRKQAVPRTKRAHPTAREPPAEDRKTSESASHGEVRYERNFPFSRGKTTEQQSQSFSMNVYTTEDPASIYTRGPGGAGEQPRPRWTPEDRIVILPGLRSDPKIKDYNRVSGDMEPDTSWTIEAVDSETSEKEEAPEVQFFYLTPNARSTMIDESDREEILYPRNLGATPSKPQNDTPITNIHDTPKRPLMPESHHSPPSLSISIQQTRNPKNHSSGEIELAQTGSRSLMSQRTGSTSTEDKAKDDNASTRKHRNFHANTPSSRDGKGKEHRRESAGLTTNALKSPLSPDKIPERHAVKTSRSSSSSNIGDGHHARRLHTTDFTHLSTSPAPSPAMKQLPPLTPNTPTAQLPPLPQLSQDPPNPTPPPPNAPAHSALRAGAQQEGWSSLDDAATADALRKLDRLAGQRARARVHSFGRPGTAAGSPVTPAGRISPGREAVNTSDSGKSKRGSGGSGGGGGVKASPFFLLRPVRKSSTSKDAHLSAPPPSLGSTLSAPAPTQVGNPPKALDRTAHATHAGAGTPAPATSPSAHPPPPTARGPTSSAHRHRPKRASPSAIPVLRRASSQSTQPPLASASDAVSSASQNTRSTKANEVRSPAGASGAGVAPSPPAKPAVPSKIVWKARHNRSSSAPLSVPHPNGTANGTLTSRATSSSSRHASLTSTTNPSLRVRRGYWNRRGDHLTPDGHVVYAPPGLAYPAELAAYPREEAGYRDETGAFVGYAERPELGASLPWRGRAPERPYESFVVYVDDESRGTSAPYWASIDPFPLGLTSPKHTAKRTPHKKSPPTTTAKQDLPKSDAESPSSQAAHPRPDPWDLDAILAAHRARRPRSPTSSSSSYGSAHSTRSRASSFSGSAGGHIPGTSRDVMEFPFGYPPANGFRSS